MNILVVILLVAGTASVVASIPQLVRLIRLKHSDEFSVISWSVWLLYQVVSLIYAFSINSVPYIVINLLWVIFYISMIVLILRYKSSKLVH